jgi:hypothetical protein
MARRRRISALLSDLYFSLPKAGSAPISAKIFFKANWLFAFLLLRLLMIAFLLAGLLGLE